MEYNLEFLATIGHLMTGFGTIVLAVLLFRTFKHLAAVTRATEIQTEYKLRPWIGPTGVINEISSDAEKKRFEIVIKNFGDLPATNVRASSVASAEKISREQLKNSKNHTDLGPVLPNMEKRYWLDIPIKTIKNARQNNGSIFSAILFEYPLSHGESEYGLMSRIGPEKLDFVHIDMWVKSPSITMQ